MGEAMRALVAALIGMMGFSLPVAAQEKPAKDERLWTCETSIAGEKTEINYVRDAEFRQNVGRMEKNFSGWGRITCPGYVTLREILRRNEMSDDAAIACSGTSRTTPISARRRARAKVMRCAARPCASG